MEDRPLVSIVIPVYNREVLVKDAINSALAQTYDKIEIVVIDNCSTDNTWRVVSNYKNPKVKIYRNENNIGPVLNWKRGIELSNGDYIKLLFSDDMISDNYIEDSLKWFDDETAFVLSPIRFLINSHLGEPHLYAKSTYTSEEYYKSLYIQFQDTFPVSPGAALFRKCDIERAFIYRIPTMKDLDPMKNGAGIDLLLFFCIAKDYQKVMISPHARAIFRVHDGSFSIENKKIVHYYFRAMIFFLSFLDDIVVNDLFKITLLRKLLRDRSYIEEYSMIKFKSKKLHRINVFVKYFKFIWGFEK